jgi:uncharacterized repeat protein (TIGR01451 family)
MIISLAFASVEGQENLNISKSISASTHVGGAYWPGDYVTYTITYGNSGQTAATNVVITDILPGVNDFSYISSVPAGVLSGNTLTWTSTQISELGSLGTTSSTILIFGRIGKIGSWGYNPATFYICSSSCNPQINNKTTIKSTLTTTPVEYTNTIQVDQHCGSTFPGGNIGMKKGANDEAFYQITLTNTGTISDKFGLTATTFVPSGDCMITRVENISGVQITNTGWLLPGEVYTFIIHLLQCPVPPQHGQTLVTTVTATSTVCGTTSQNTINTEVVNGQIPTDLQITKSASVDPAIANVNFTYTIIVANTGADATNVTLTDILDPDVTWISNSAGGVYNNNPANPVVTWSAQTYVAGVPKTYTITVRPKCTAIPSISNFVQVPVGGDAQPSNNSFTLSTLVVDNVVPTAVCKPATIQLNSSGIATLNPSAIDNGSSDNCPNITLTAVPSTFDCTNIGGNSVVLIVTDASGNSSTCSTTVTVTNSVPSITSQPANSTVCQGQTATFTIAATPADASFQWQENTGSGWNSLNNSGIYSGVNLSTLTITGTLASMNGYQYRCIAGGSCGLTATSNIVTLTVNPLSVGGTIASDATVCAGSNSGTLTLSGQTGNVVQWEFSTNGGTSWTPIANTTLTLSYLNLTATTLYRAIVKSGICTTATSSTATISMGSTLIPGGHDVLPISACIGYDPPALIIDSPVTSGGVGPYTFDWQLNGVSLGATSSASYDPPALMTAGTYVYRCKVVDFCGASQFTATKTITIVTDPTATISGGGEVCLNSIVTLTGVVAGGTGAVTYQWQSSPNNLDPWTDVSGEINPIYTPPTTAEGTMFYRLHVTSSGLGCDDILSASVMVTVNPLPGITCPANISTQNSPGLCSASVDFAAIATGNPVPSITYKIGAATITSPYSFPVGITTVDATASNSCGTVTCSFTVTVSDDEAPVITCNASGIQTVMVNSGNVYIHSGSGWDAIALDNCSVSPALTLTAALTGATISSGHNSLNGVTFNTGTTTVTWTATDAAGKTTTCTFDVTVMGQADIQVTKTATPEPVAAGANIEYTIIVTNLGPATAPTVTLTDVLPAAILNPSFTLNGGTSSPWTNPYLFTGLIANSPQTIKITGKVDCTTSSSFSNTATAALGILTDPNPDNNTATVTSTLSAALAITAVTTNVSCPGKADGSIDITVTGGTGPYTFDWDNNGLQDPDTDPEDLTGLSAGDYTVIVTDVNGCSKSAIFTVGTTPDTTPPTFDTPTSPASFCVVNLISAAFVSNDLQINPEPDYYLLPSGNTALDLDPVTLNFNDNCCADNQLVIHWRIDFTDIPNPGPPPATLSHAPITGTGQPSAYGSDIKLWGDGVNFSTITHTITYWLTDCNGNQSTDHTLNIQIKPRPQIIKN